MERIKCSECGSNDIVRDNWFYKCNHCNALYNLDSAGKASAKLDQLLDVGCTALENEDFRNATSFFKQALDINPNNGVVYHYYNYSSDNEYLDKGGKRSIEILARGLRGKMGTILDMYHQIADLEQRNEMLSEAIVDFDALSRRIATEIFRRDCDREENLRNIDVAFQSSIDKLKDNNESNDLVIDLSDRYRDYCDQINNIFSKEKVAQELSFREMQEIGDRAFHEIQEEQARREADKNDGEIKNYSVFSIVLLVAAAAFLLLTVSSISNGWGISYTVVFGLAMAACISGVINNRGFFS